MKKIILLSLIISSVFGKAYINGKETDQNKLCEALKYSLVDIFNAAEEYHSILKGNKVKCTEIDNFDLQKISGEELFGSIVGVNYLLTKDGIKTGTCSKEKFKENILKEAIKLKVKNSEEFEKAIEEGRKLTEKEGCKFQE